MPDNPSSEPPLHQILRQIEERLSTVEATPFSPQAFANLKDKINRFVIQLMDESLKVASRSRSDTVSASHVDRASEYLFFDTSRRLFRHLGTVGGIFAGASLSNLLSMTTSGVYTLAGILVTTGLALVGGFLIAFHIARD